MKQVSRKTRAACSGGAKIVKNIGAAYLLTVLLVGCEQEKLLPTNIGSDNQTAKGTTNTQHNVTNNLASLPSGLNAAVISSIQQSAPSNYNLTASSHSQETAVGIIAGGTTRVELSAEKVTLLGNKKSPVSMYLEGYECNGDEYSLTATTTEYQNNKYTTQYVNDAGDRVEAWYYSGPLGLEQGFTLNSSMGCTSAITLKVRIIGADVTRKDANALVFSTKEGPAYTYSHLFANDGRDNNVASVLKQKDDIVLLEIETQDAIFPVRVDPLVGVLQQKLTAIDAIANESFGFSVAIDGDTAVVGAGNDAPSGIAGAGSVYVYTRTGNTWTQQAKLVASDAATNNHLGNAVAISGDTIVAGAPAADAPTLSSGAAYVFTRTAGVWSEQQKLIPNDPQVLAEFGGAVAISNNTAVLGARNHDPGPGSGTGAAYVFLRTGVSWAQEQKLTASDGAASDYYGLSVAIDTDTVVIGAYEHDTIAGADAGQAYVYKRTGVTWTESQILTANDASFEAQFGAAVTISGNVIVVGAYGDDSFAGPDAGSAYAFFDSGSGFTQEQKLIASDAVASYYFGYSVSLVGNLLVVGSPNSTQVLGNEGAAYVFSRNAGVWTELSKLSAADAGGGDFSGDTVGISGSTIIFGSHFHDLPLNNTGAAYVHILALGQGDPCSLDSECASGSCVDTVCCDSPCGGNIPNDCQACSVATGASVDGTCTPLQGTLCDDLDACSMVDTCQVGTCVGSSLVMCSALDSCHTAGTCNPMTGICDDPPLPDGTGCDDGDLCTTGDSCGSGVCTAGTAVQCMPGGACTADGVCDPQTGVCGNAPLVDGTPCDAMSPCTDNTCVLGACVVGGPLVCTPGECQLGGSCDVVNGGCLFQNQFDGTPCSVGYCMGGECIADGTGGSGQGGTGGASGSGAGASAGASGSGAFSQGGTDSGGNAGTSVNTGGSGDSAAAGTSGTAGSAGTSGAAGSPIEKGSSSDDGCSLAKATNNADSPHKGASMLVLLSLGYFARRRQMNRLF